MSEATENFPAVDGASRLARRFAADVVDLGADGLCDWLLASFSGPAPSHVLGRFYSESEDLLGTLFLRVWRDFTPSTQKVAKDGVLAAVERFDAATGTLYGLLELVRLVEAVKGDSAIPKIAQILSSWLLRNPTYQHLDLKSYESIVAVREIFECLYRLLPVSIRLVNERVFEPAAILACDLLIRGSAMGRALIPAYAPIYFLARLISFTSGDQFRLNTALQSAYRRSDEVHPEFFEFQSQNAPDAVFAYDLDELQVVTDIFHRPGRAILTPRGYDSLGERLRSATSPRRGHLPEIVGGDRRLFVKELVA